VTFIHATGPKIAAVAVKYVDMNNSLYNYVMSMKRGGHRGLGLRLLFRYVCVYFVV